MKSIKIGIIVAIAVIGVLAMAGSAQAMQGVYGLVNDVEFGGQGEAVGKIVTIWIENNSANFHNQVIEDGSPDADYYYEVDIMDLPGYPGSGSVFVSVQMFASGTDEDGVPYDNDGCYFAEINKSETVSASYVWMPDVDQTCSKTFNKHLDLEWNLISLPLTSATDMTVENIINTSLGGSYDALCKYNAISNNYETLSSTDVMENGVGYFIHMTQADTWTYSGAGYTSMNEPLEDGLNMVGWMDCNKTISSGLTSIAGNYTYAASWNATAQEFETYNPAAPDPDTPGGFNDFFDMERGTGYFISMKVSDTLDESC